MKIGQLFNLGSAQRFCDATKSLKFSDADSGIVLARTLTQVDPTIFEKKYPELAFVSSGIDADNTGGYAEQIKSLRRLTRGAFSRSKDRSDGKGIISMATEDNFIRVYEKSATSAWSDTEVKQAAMENRNLISDLIAAHNEVYLREVDEIGYLGLAGIAASTGLLNHPGFTSGAAAGAITALTAQQMYDEVSDLITSQFNAVNNTVEYKANRVDMPNYVLHKLQVTILNSAAGPLSVLNALKANYPGVEFRATFRADNAGGVGVSHTVAYSNNAEAMRMRIPQPLTIGEIIKKGSFDHEVDSKYRIAGLDVLENTAGYIMTGL